MSIKSLQQELADFAAARDWNQFHDPKSLVLALVSEVGELAELFQWLSPEQASDIMASSRKADRVGEEMADVFGYLLRLADVLDIDLEQAMSTKIAINERKYPVEKARGHATKYTDL